MKRRLCLASAWLILLVTSQAEDKIVLPFRWGAGERSGKLLIFAHGYRPEGFPNPVTLDLDAVYYQEFSYNGWILAATSYPKTGLVVKEGADDIDRLRDEIEKKYGPIKICLLHGESMGGTIATLLAERDPKRYQGALAVGAALEIMPKDLLLHGPQIPLLFLANQSEAKGPAEYVERFRSKGVPLAVWKVSRDGHVNVKQAEVLAALEALDPSLGGRPLVDRDGTIVLPPGPSVAKFSEKGLEVPAWGIDPVYGNFMVSVQEGDLARLGWKRGDTFPISVGKKTRKVFYGSEFNDVPESQWVAFPTADGLLRIAMNIRNAAKDLGIEENARLEIRKK